jgi:ribose/xylose/arabinose/galactoside ABC-type transport system permease subunit
LFILSGAMAGLAALTLLSRLGVARFDHAQGLELDVITAVVLGGASIFGGRGTVAGSLIALLLIGVVQTGMGVAGVKSETQVASIGALLLGAVLIANLTRRGARA